MKKTKKPSKLDLEIENATLKRIVQNLHWMARRYADGRQTYATSMMNEATRDLLRMGVNLNMCDGTLWARDGGGRPFDGLTDEEASMGREPDWKGDGLQRENEKLKKEVERLEDLLDLSLQERISNE